MDNKSNGKLIALAIGGAVVMGALFFGVSFLTGYKVPAENISTLLTPLSSFAGWFMLIFCASIIIMTLGKMSSRISDRWVLSFPLGALGLVALLFIILWIRPSGFLLPTTGRTTTLEGKAIRSVPQLTAFLNGDVDFENATKESLEKAAAEAAAAPPAAGGETASIDFDAAKALVDTKCNKCHTLDSVKDKMKKYIKQGETEKIVLTMKAVPNSGITDADVKQFVSWFNAKY
ncbi:MAG: cytochrome C [Chlorobi bacterium]|nr:cytochrome C [Chlorobiota bacterium]